MESRREDVSQQATQGGSVMTGSGQERADSRSAYTQRPALRLLRVAGLTLLLISGLGLAFVAGDWVTFLFFTSYALAGSLLVLRRPKNVSGWLLLAVGWGLGIATLTVPTSPNALRSGTAPFADELLGWATTLGPEVGLSAMAALFFVLPTGGMARGPWRSAAVAALAVTLAFTLLSAFAPTIVVTPSGQVSSIAVPNQLAISPGWPGWGLLPPGIVLDLDFALVVAGAIGLFVRYRGAAGIQRLQLRWVVAAVGLVATAPLVGLLANAVGPIAYVPAMVAFPTVPAAIAIAVLRYRLFEIDLLINRTAVYGSVAFLLAAAFGLANIGAQRLLEAVTHQRSDLVTGLLAVVAALAFAPTLRRVRPVADRLLPRRATLALLFTDIVESTRKAVELGDERWRELLARYRNMVRRELARSGGLEVDTAGDGFFATFGQPLGAVRCAWQMRAGATALRLETRTGLHLGECETRGEKVTGVAVHAAARVMSMARPDAILVSAALLEAIANAAPAVNDRGRHELKGVPGEWQLYSLEGF